MVHLVYTDKREKELALILSGKKTMVIRGAAGRKIPHSRVYAGELIYFMEKGSQKITAQAIVKDVHNYTKLLDDEIKSILEKNQAKLLLSDRQKNRWHKKCLCLVEFEQVRKIEPLAFDHQSNMDDWLIIEKIADIVIGTSKPFNYQQAKFKK